MSHQEAERRSKPSRAFWGQPAWMGPDEGVARALVDILEAAGLLGVRIGAFHQHREEPASSLDSHRTPPPCLRFSDLTLLPGLCACFTFPALHLSHNRFFSSTLNFHFSVTWIKWYTEILITLAAFIVISGYFFLLFSYLLVHVSQCLFYDHTS